MLAIQSTRKLGSPVTSSLAVVVGVLAVAGALAYGAVNRDHRWRRR